MSFLWPPNDTKNRDADGVLRALSNTQPMVWMSLDGQIKDANDNFLNATGYTKEEIIGKPHTIFLEEEYARSDEYKRIWSDLNAGKPSTGEFNRKTKDGRTIWLEASYNPTLDQAGQATGVVALATDVTEKKMKNSDVEGQLEAINRSYAVIEFDLNWTILSANKNFCDAMGYTEQEIIGKKHMIFLDSEFANSYEYQEFQQSLRSGQFQAAEFKRIRKDGQEIWIQASYNPIFDNSGKPYKIVKYATDVTERRRVTQLLAENLQSLAGGNLSARMPGSTSPEFSDLCTAFNETMTRLSEMVSSIQTSTNEVSKGSREIATSARDLSTQTEKQASSLQETNAAIEEISNNVASSAQSALMVTDAAQDAESRAVQGESVVRSAISAMERIEDGSKKISEIIGVIESIAFQTNLLALNAAVEAARAGESGKGFAVVASEVRTLAQRSSEAASDITQLIQSSTAQVVEGAELVRSTGSVLEEIKGSIERVVTNVDEISEATGQQASSIKEISSVVADIDTNTQSNAQSAQRSAANANNLANESDHLAQLASFFGVNPSQNSRGTNQMRQFAKSA